MQPHALVHSMFAGAELLLSLGALLADLMRWGSELSSKQQDTASAHAAAGIVWVYCSRWLAKRSKHGHRTWDANSSLPG